MGKSSASYEDAVAQSKEEVLAIFLINEDDVANFNKMNITESGASNSILLAISSILQQNREVSEMSEFISKLSLDIANNGKVDDAILIAKIKESSQDVNSAEIISNLEERYSELGLNVDIDNFYDFIDSDGDGTLNGGKPYLLVDDNYIDCDYMASEQTIYFTANYTPEVKIVGEDMFATVKEITATKIVLDISANTGKPKRSVDVQLLSEVGELAESITIEQYSSYTALSFGIMSGNGTRATIPNTDIELDRITLIAYDNIGNLLFNVSENSPALTEYGGYTAYVQFKDNYYENCTLYAIANGDESLFAFNGTASELEEMKSAVGNNGLMTGKNEGESFSNGKPSFDEDEYIVSPNFEPYSTNLQYNCAKIKIDVVDEYGNNLDRNILGAIKLNGTICTEAYLFKEQTVESNSTNHISIDSQSSSVLIGAGSVISNSTFTYNGKELMVDYNSFSIERGTQYILSFRFQSDGSIANSVTIADGNTGGTDLVTK